MYLKNQKNDLLQKRVARAKKKSGGNCALNLSDFEQLLKRFFGRKQLYHDFERLCLQIYFFITFKF